MRVLILSQYYKPEPVPKPGELAEELRRRGHDVTVLTGFPNYPTGRLYPGASLKLLRREEINGVPVTRTFELPYHGQGIIGRFLNYGSFMASATLGGALGLRPDVIYVWHPPLTVGIAAAVIARVRRVPFVYDVQDIWPEAAVISGMLKDGWLIRLISRVERLVYREADHILVVTPGARENLVAKGVPPEKLSVMPHWVDDEPFREPENGGRQRIREKYGWIDRWVVLFAGNIGLVQGLDTVVEAAGRLRADSRVLIALVGDGADKERLQALVRERRLGKVVQFIERQPMESMPTFMAAAVLLVHLKRSQFSSSAIPTKTLAYLAAGRPILMAMEGAAGELIDAAGAGLVIEPGNPAAMVESIEEFCRMPTAELDAFGRRGQEYLVKHLSKAKVISDYESMLVRTACSGRR